MFGDSRQGVRLTEAQRRLLAALGAGASLKSHRYLDGTKACRLHPLDQPAASEPVAAADVAALERLGLIRSNMKFPAATYLLTAKGEAVRAALEGAPASSKVLIARG